MVLDSEQFPFSFRGERERYTEQHGHEQLRAHAEHTQAVTLWVPGSRRGVRVSGRSVIVLGAQLDTLMVCGVSAPQI